MFFANAGFLARCVVAAFGVAAAADAAAVTLLSPGFELGPDTTPISFAQTGIDDLGWLASHTDGERLRDASGRPAAEGRFYAGLLQNAGRYDGSALGIGSFGSAGFDRIYTFFSVVPSATYEVSFEHAGDNRAGYRPDTSVVEIVDAGSNTTLSLMSFATPSLFNWQTATFQFTTGSTTTNAAIAFTVSGAGGTAAVFDNVQISVIPEPATNLLFAAGVLFGAVYLRRSRIDRKAG